MLPSPPIDYGDLKFDFDGLAFLIQTEHRQLLVDLVLAQNKFLSAVQLMNMRSAIRSEVSPLLEQAGLVGNITPEQIYRALGERRWVELLRITNDAIEQVDDSITFTIEMRDKLCGALKALYPKEIVINFKSVEESDGKHENAETSHRTATERIFEGFRLILRKILNKNKR